MKFLLEKLLATPRRSTWLFVVVASTLAVTPIIVAVVALLSGDAWFPAGDMAQAELHMRGFFSHPPLVGAAGRIVSDAGLQGSHPGPGLWVAMLPVYLLGGRSSHALLAAAASVHIVSVILVVRLAMHRGGRLLAVLTALAALLVIRASGPDFMIEPWNPWLAILPFMIFIFLVGEVVAPIGSARQKLWALIGAILVGSYCIQCHAGYAVLVVGALAVAVVVWIRDEYRSPNSPDVSAHQPRVRVLRGLSFGVIALSVAWLPVVIDQFRRQPGNLTILWEHFVSPSEPAMGVAQAAKIIATQFNLFGLWLTGPGADAPAEGWARYIGCFMLCALWVLATWKVKHAKQSSMLRWQFLMAGMVLIGAFSILRIFGPYYEYTVRWFWILSVLTAITSIFFLVRMYRVVEMLRSSQARLHTVLAGAGVVVVGLVMMSSLQTADRVKLPGKTESRILADLIPEVIPSLNRDDQYLLKIYDPYTLDATGFGSVLELERQGFDVGIEFFRSAAGLPHRVREESNVDTVLWVVVGPAIKRADADPTLTKLGEANPRSESEEVVAQQLLIDVSAMLTTAGRDDLVAALEVPGASLIFAEPPLPDDIATVVRKFISLGQPVAMYSVAPGVSVTSLE
ncbi:MAG: hypothetical protein O3B91_06915 [Actinomycetota bacterium]|nr:hypothetical protein [Actinomycetota bacterium]MDA3020129.1 hypothetical protein [Actinomycetota bacterium]